MPNYNYRCENCGDILTQHKIGETLAECPNCKGEVKRIFKSANFVLKEGSFYSKKVR